MHIYIWNIWSFSTMTSTMDLIAQKFAFPKVCNKAAMSVYHFSQKSASLVFEDRTIFTPYCLLPLTESANFHHTGKLRGHSLRTRPSCRIILPLRIKNTVQPPCYPHPTILIFGGLYVFEHIKDTLKFHQSYPSDSPYMGP